MDFFGSTTSRIKDLRDMTVEAGSGICLERARILTKVYKDNESTPVILKRALAVKRILEEMTIYISKGELIVGNQSSKPRAAPIFPEYAVDWIFEEIDDFDKRPGDKFFLSDAQKKELISVINYWKGKTLKDKALSIIPDESRRLCDIGLISAEGNMTSGDGHIAVNYKNVLEKGINGISKDVEARRKAIDTADPKQLKKLHFLKAVSIVLGAVADFASRYAKLANSLKKNEKDEKRSAELDVIENICSSVPLRPASSFYEAVQSVWFMHLILQIESNGHSVSYGRLDQYLYPYYINDVENNKIDEEKACELLENLWIKTYSLNKIRSWGHTKFSAGSPLYQNVTIGGQTAEGSDAVNELSFLILKTVGRMHLPQPNLTVRYHSGLDDTFLLRCIDVMKLGFGMPAFNNDEAIIPSFIEKGVKREDAYEYSAVGCVEVAVPGKWGYRCTGMSFLNFAKTLMTALNGGIEMVTGERVCEVYKHFLDMEDIDDLMSSWSKTVRAFTKHTLTIDAGVDLALEQNTPDVLCSALTNNCIERGLHLKEGGAVYDFVSGLQVGIANIGNSIAAIKKLVFEEQKLTKKQLWEALENDFAGEEGERIRRLLVNSAPKYGNDDDYVDELLVEAYEEYIDEISKYRNSRYGRGPIGCRYYAGTSSISANIPSGAATGATPDGRKAYTPLAEGASPFHGTDIKGPTSVFKSVSKLPASKILGGILLNQKMSPINICSEEDTSKFIHLLRTFFDDLKGFHVQYNMIDKKTLLDAKKHPEAHRDLIVRVAGYSAFFNVLSPEVQDDIISRTEQTL